MRFKRGKKKVYRLNFIIIYSINQLFISYNILTFYLHQQRLRHHLIYYLDPPGSI